MEKGSCLWGGTDEAIGHMLHWCNKTRQLGWEDGSVSQVFVLQISEPESVLRTHGKKLDIVTRACNPSSGEVQTASQAGRPT